MSHSDLKTLRMERTDTARKLNAAMRILALPNAYTRSLEDWIDKLDRMIRRLEWANAR
jgi:hypothetical protein